MKKQKNFGLSQQTSQKESYDHFKLGKNWDLGFISKEGLKNKRDSVKMNNERKRLQNQAMQQLISEPTQQNQGGGISTGAAITIGVVVVVGVLIGLRMMNKKRKAKQAVIGQSSQAVKEIV